MTQLLLAACQKTLGSRKSLRPRSMTGLPGYFVQVAPPSRLKAMFWVCLSCEAPV